jgi:hypothetical protein
MLESLATPPSRTASARESHAMEIHRLNSWAAHISAQRATISMRLAGQLHGGYPVLEELPVMADMHEGRQWEAAHAQLVAAPFWRVRLDGAGR